MRLILHVGTHKTGTTSIQTALASNRRWLAERGYIFPPLCVRRRSHNEFAHGIALAKPALLEELRTNLLSRSGPDRTTIISAEEMSVRIAGTRDWEGYNKKDYWDRRLEYLERLRTVIRDFDDIAVHLCLRRADKYAEALYATQFLGRQVRFRGSFERFISAVAPVFEYSRQIEAFRSVFPNVQVISFDDLARDLVPGFFRWTGIPMPADIAQYKRITPDMRLVYWLTQMIGAHDGDQAQCRLWVKFLASRDSKHLFSSDAAATFWPSQTDRDAFALRSGVGLPDGFFSSAPPPKAVDARLERAELDRVSQAFESWQATLRPPNSRSRGRSIVSWFRAAYLRARAMSLIPL